MKISNKPVSIVGFISSVIGLLGLLVGSFLFYIFPLPLICGIFLLKNRITKKDLITGIRYRMIGTTQWIEQELIPISLAFDVDLFGLLSGQAYEYQYILDDNSNNQFITEWVRI